jgi:hypothetical protein
LLGEYEKERDKYPSLVEFMPRVITFFEDLSKNLEERMAKFPKVVRITPANGAKDVDPQASELVIEFDRPMNKSGRALVGNQKIMPAFPRQGGYDADGKTFRQPIKLEPGKTYRFSLNSMAFSGFSSVEGVPMDPVEVTFTTRK